MKRKISICIIITLVVLLSFVAVCSFWPDKLHTKQVNFYVDGKLYESKDVVVGLNVSEPIPPKKENQIFVGWGIKGDVAYKFDFSTKIINNLDLNAYFVIDAVSLTNMITNHTMKSVVTIKNEMIKGTATVNTSQGSGVVVDISDGYCYVLTNNHVVEKNIPNSKQIIIVEDPWGNVYEAKIYKNASKTDYAKSEEYDLALVCFKYTPGEKNSLQELGMGENPKLDDYVVSIGSPAGLQNAITYGKVVGYHQINVKENSSLQKVNFDVIFHNAPIDHGSSGGALVNTRGELVGINFAGYDEATYGCAIPISKVLEFMNLYVY